MLRLNLGSGTNPVPEVDGWVNIDRNIGTEVYPLGYDDGSVDEIRASHILEHFPKAQIFEVLRHWVSKLKPGGLIKISVPDFKKICIAYTEGKKLDISGILMGGQIDDNDYHKSILDQSSLAKFMAAARLVEIKTWVSEHNDSAKLPISLNLQGIKGESVAIKTDTIKAIMSAPRLGFIDNSHTALIALGECNIEMARGHGVWWDQVLTRLIDNMIELGAETIITLDYDTWFTEMHVKTMLWLLEKYPEADAICPVQIKREHDEVLVGVVDKEGYPVSGIAQTDFSGELTRVATAHFGMTFFRTAALKKLKKPWFIGVPDPNDGWGEGRQDPDIYFWNNWNRCGLKLFQANRVPIAHLQLMATFPGTAEDNFKPFHVYMNDLDMGRFPAHCIPSGG